MADTGDANEEGHFDREVGALREWALSVQQAAAVMKVIPDTLAAANLDRARLYLADLLVTIEAIPANGDERLRMLDKARERLRAITVTLEAALYMGGVNARDGPTVYELKRIFDAALCALPEGQTQSSGTWTLSWPRGDSR